MDFFTFVWLFSLTILLPAAIVKLTLDYKRQRLEMGQGLPIDEGGGGASGQPLTLRELKGVLRDVVAEANLPIEQRIDALEQSLGSGSPRPRLPAHQADDADDLADHEHP